ncbi:hypothetical protein [Serratia symbiotica]
MPADDPHHIIDHGLGGTGTRPHDIFTLPLTRACHTRLHDLAIPDFMMM